MAIEAAPVSLPHLPQHFLHIPTRPDIQVRGEREEEYVGEWVGRLLAEARGLPPSSRHFARVCLDEWRQMNGGRQVCWWSRQAS